MSTTDGSLGFIGLGAMGGAMAARLIAHGHELAVFDSRSEAMEPLTAVGAAACESPLEVANRAETVFVSLPTPEAVTVVVGGKDGLCEGSAIRSYVDLSTTGPTAAHEIAKLLLNKKISYLDAPVSGGPSGAKEGRLTIIASGSRELFDCLEPLLSVFGTNVFHVGEEPGLGQLAKLVNNLLSATAIAITGEALALGVKGGLDPERLLEIINVSSGRNTASADKYPRCVLTRRFDYGFRLKLMVKDVGLCLAEGDRTKTPMLLGSAVQQLWKLADVHAAEQDDCTAIAQLFEDWAGVTIEPHSS